MKGEGKFGERGGGRDRGREGEKREKGREGEGGEEMNRGEEERERSITCSDPLPNLLGKGHH